MNVDSYAMDGYFVFENDRLSKIVYILSDNGGDLEGCFINSANKYCIFVTDVI